MSGYYCECCNRKMKRVYSNLTRQTGGVEFYKCDSCKLLWAPKLDMDMSFVSRLDEKNRREALEDMRNREFEIVEKMLMKQIKKGKGLEVGCSYGWFMEKVKDRYDMDGIEAEDQIAQKAREKGLNVFTGLFPEGMVCKRKYDFIAFNNVWEHINHTDKLVESSLEYLREDGYMVITVPLSTGGIYRIAECLEKLGRTKEIGRLWQLHFHSPHVYYFTKGNLEQLMLKHGCVLLEYRELRSIDIKKMKARFEMDVDEKFAGVKAELFKCLWPVLKRMPADKTTFLFQYRPGR